MFRQMQSSDLPQGLSLHKVLDVELLHFSVCTKRFRRNVTDELWKRQIYSTRRTMKSLKICEDSNNEKLEDCEHEELEETKIMYTTLPWIL
uniref:F-box domain-containing protein n=1 Tax=Parascaris univalens TaxID=6257 RepID=A0A915A132_PARUN